MSTNDKNKPKAPAPPEGGQAAAPAPSERHGGASPLRLVAAGAVCALAAALAGFCCALALAGHGVGASEPEAPAQAPAASRAAEAASHAHDWAPLTETVRHEAVTETVEHPEERAERTALHTVCNECEEVIDGAAEAHIAETGHRGYTTGVPVAETVLASPAWTEEVVVQEGYDETVELGRICVSCGEVERADAAPSATAE